MAVSKTSTINKALVLCGATTVTSITQDTENARNLNTVYEISLKDILSECKWNFATTRTTLAISADTLAWSSETDTYVYTRPTSIIRIFGTSDKNAIWREEGDYIISNTANLGIKFVYYHDDPSKYPAYFLNAFIDKLCADIAFMVINSAKMAEGFLTKYEKVSLPKAKSANSQVGEQQSLIDDAWTGAKFGNGDPARSYD